MGHSTGVPSLPLLSPPLLGVPERKGKEKRERNAVFKELGDNYVEPLWLNPNLEDSPEEDEEDG